MQPFEIIILEFVFNVRIWHHGSHGYLEPKWFSILSYDIFFMNMIIVTRLKKQNWIVEIFEIIYERINI